MGISNSGIEWTNIKWEDLPANQNSVIWKVSSSGAIDSVIERLNSTLKSDPDLIQQIINQKFHCRPETDVIVNSDGKTSFLGVLNTILADLSQDRIAVCYQNGEIAVFCRYSGVQ